MKKLFILAFAALLSACASADTKQDADITAGTKSAVSAEDSQRAAERAFDKYFNDIALVSYNTEDSTKLLAQSNGNVKNILADAESKNDAAIKEMTAAIAALPDQRDISAKYFLNIVNTPLAESKAEYADKIALCAAKKADCNLPVLLSLYKKYDFLLKAEPVLKGNLADVQNTKEQSAECAKGTTQNCKQGYKAVTEKTTTVTYTNLVTYLNPPVLQEETSTQKQSVTVTCESGFNAKDNSCQKNFTKTIIDEKLGGDKTVITCKSSKNGKCIGGGKVFSTGNFCRCGNYTYDLTVTKNADGSWSWKSEYTAPHNGDETKSCAKFDGLSNRCLDKESQEKAVSPTDNNSIAGQLSLPENAWESFYFD